MMPFNFQEGETLLIDKPLEWTSFDVVGKIRNEIRKALQIKKLKVGHAGTLDPLATGLLVICTGAHTKLIAGYQGEDKEYTGTIRLGATTPSFDLETPVDHTYPIEQINLSSLKQAASDMTGPIMQEPPLFSAKWVDGKRAYDLARKGEEKTLDKVRVVIEDFEVTAWESPDLFFRIKCSKGTYIRSIARDIGIAVGSGGYLTSLRRTRSGSFHIDDALNIDQITQIIRSLSGKG